MKNNNNIIEPLKSELETFFIDVEMILSNDLKTNLFERLSEIFNGYKEAESNQKYLKRQSLHTKKLEYFIEQVAILKKASESIHAEVFELLDNLEFNAYSIIERASKSYENNKFTESEKTFIQDDGDPPYALLSDMTANEEDDLFDFFYPALVSFLKKLSSDPFALYNINSELFMELDRSRSKLFLDSAFHFLEPLESAIKRYISIFKRTKNSGNTKRIARDILIAKLFSLFDKVFWSFKEHLSGENDIVIKNKLQETSSKARDDYIRSFKAINEVDINTFIYQKAKFVSIICTSWEIAIPKLASEDDHDLSQPDRMYLLAKNHTLKNNMRFSKYIHIISKTY